MSKKINMSSGIIKVNINLSLDLEDRLELDKIASMYEVTRQQVLRLAVKRFIKHIKLTHKDYEDS